MITDTCIHVQHIHFDTLQFIYTHGTYYTYHYTLTFVHAHTAAVHTVVQCDLLATHPLLVRTLVTIISFSVFLLTDKC